jgi:hypothetical protein
LPALKMKQCCDGERRARQRRGGERGACSSFKTSFES